MAVAWSDVVNLVPEMSAIASTSAQDALLTFASLQVDPCAWGDLADYGVIYLAAHLAKIGLLRGGGAVTEQQVGQMSKSYATVQGITGSLGLTSYGAEFEDLARRASLGAFVA